MNILYGEQLLGIPPLDGGTGGHQKDAIIELLDIYDIRNNIVALCQDTTAANTGPYKGAFIMLCKELGVALLRVDCRHHIKELHIKHYAGPVTPRGTSSPGDALFKAYRKQWDTINQEEEDFMSKLVFFEWPEDNNSFISIIAYKSLKLINEFLAKDTFKRGDYKYLCQLVKVFLSRETQGFRFRKPAAVSHARFMQRALNYISIKLLGPLVKYMEMSTSEKREVDMMVTFASLFYIRWFLQSTLTAEAAVLDLESIQEVRQLVTICQKANDKDKSETNLVALKAAKACLNNIYGHLDYLTEANIVFALAGSKMTDKDKTIIADCLLGLLCDNDIDEFEATMEKKVDILSIWPEDTSEPDLGRFVGRRSYLVFYHLGMLDPESLF